VHETAAWIYVVAINLTGAWMFGLDKRRAIAGGRRLPERLLLLAAWSGGALGAVAGQILFRHKTRKQPFATLVRLALLSQLALAWRLLS
jgi:uncharacterized membrane protein YsdA (DUF1294 family)